MSTQRRRGWEWVDVPDAPRRTITWVVGMGLGVWETLAQQQPRPAVYAFAGSLIGVPELIARLRRKEEADDGP